jgi:ribosomal protein S18 acetylase RimI-like enzyme
MLRYYGWLDALRVLKKAYPSFNHPEARVDEYHIAHLAVAQFQQRQGVASALLGEAENLAQRSGYRKCSLCVDLDNDPARALYDRHGYTVADTFDTPELMERYGNPGYERRVKHL